MTPLLQLSGLSISFGGLRAVSELDLAVQQGEIFALIGPNGAGKTTVFNCITGFYEPSAGKILMQTQPIVGKPPHVITRSGIARTFQNIRLFPNMSALENVLVGTDATRQTSVPGALLRTPRLRREENQAHKRAAELLSFVGIGNRGAELARNLSYGDQRRLEIARALGTDPRLLLLDEPAAGMNPAEKAELMNLIRKVRDRGVTILMIDHDMRVVMGISNRIAVLNFGMKIAEGQPEDVRKDPSVIAAYLGEASDDE